MILHEFPHEIGDFAYLLKKKYSLILIFFTQILTSSGALIGALTGTF